MRNAKNYIGESAGLAITVEFRRHYINGKIAITPGLSILPDTIIAAHYSEKNRHDDLRKWMKLSQARIGIGIDSLSSIEIDTDTYPKKYSTQGDGLVEVVS